MGRRWRGEGWSCEGWSWRESWRDRREGKEVVTHTHGVHVCQKSCHILLPPSPLTLPSHLSGSILFWLLSSEMNCWKLLPCEMSLSRDTKFSSLQAYSWWRAPRRCWGEEGGKQPCDTHVPAHKVSRGCVRTATSGVHCVLCGVCTDGRLNGRLKAAVALKASIHTHCTHHGMHYVCKVH